MLVAKFYLTEREGEKPVPGYRIPPIPDLTPKSGHKILPIPDRSGKLHPPLPPTPHKGKPT